MRTQKVRNHADAALFNPRLNVCLEKQSRGRF